MIPYRKVAEKCIYKWEYVKKIEDGEMTEEEAKNKARWEAENLPVDELMARTDKSVGKKNSVVLLMHDAAAKTTTVEALPQIISYFRDRGFEFVNFYEIIK